MAIYCKMPPFTTAMFIDASKTVLRKVNQRTFLWNYFKIWLAVSEIFFKNFSMPYSAKTPIHQSHVYWRIKILWTSFKKGQPRNIPVTLFQNLTSGFREEDFLIIFLVHIVQKAPIYHSHAYWCTKISRTTYRKGHPRNIPVKLFQNRTSSFREEDISSCPYSERSPHSPEPCLRIDQNLANNFWKG